MLLIHAPRPSLRSGLRVARMKISWLALRNVGPKTVSSPKSVKEKHLRSKYLAISLEHAKQMNLCMLHMELEP